MSNFDGMTFHESRLYNEPNDTATKALGNKCMHTQQPHEEKGLGTYVSLPSVSFRGCTASPTGKDAQREIVTFSWPVIATLAVIFNPAETSPHDAPEVTVAPLDMDEAMSLRDLPRRLSCANASV